MVRVGGKKSFIDKKNSTTYNLIYRASEVPVDGEENEPERQLVDSRLGIGIGRVDEESVSAAANSSRDFRFGPNHPLAWMQVPSPPISHTLALHQAPSRHDCINPHPVPAYTMRQRSTRPQSQPVASNLHKTCA